MSFQSADLEDFAPGSPGPGPVRLLYVGRLVEDKNLRRLIQAVRGLDAQLEVCGTGPLEEELRGLAENVHFRGYVAPEDLPARFAAADALVLPSLYEPFGVAVREAAAAGLPIVCSRTAGAAGDFAVEGRNAVLVDPLDVGSIRRGAGAGGRRRGRARAHGRREPGDHQRAPAGRRRRGLRPRGHPSSRGSTSSRIRLTRASGRKGATSSAARAR